jgi:hypothetical protein
MGLFGKLLKTGLDVVTTPIEVVKDAATLGGLCTDQDETYTMQRLKRLADDAEEVRDKVDDL